MLAIALNGKAAFRRFKDVLHNTPAERERWFEFHQERVNRAMTEWLEGNDIEPTNPLPK